MRYIVLLFFSLNAIVWSYAQTEALPDYYDNTAIEPQTITENDLESYKADKDFDYTETKKEDTFLDKAIRWLQNILRQFWEAIFGVGTATGFLYFVFRILPYILLAVLLFLLIRFFLKVNSNVIITNAQEEGTVHYSEEEQIIKNEDIGALIKKAITQKNYRLAIRYYYLLCLKHLTEKQSIAWQPQKTNEDYIKEIKDEQLKLNFEKITKIYDYVWYGEFNIDALKFESLKGPFESLKTAVHQ